MNQITESVHALAPSAQRPSEVGPLSEPAAVGARTRLRSLFSWGGRALPTALVLIALIALGFWGHHTGWKVSKLSDLTGDGGAETDDWCAEHGVPESKCVECDPTLLAKPPSYGWCETHRVQNCPWEHPDVAQLATPAQVSAGDSERAQAALRFAERPKNDKRCKLHSRRIQFASREALDRVGIDLFEAERSRIEESILANGEVTYDQNRVSPLSSPVSGRIWSIEVSLGMPVQKGEVLALVDAAEVGKAKTELSQALALVGVRSKAMKAIEPLYRKGSFPEAKYREAEAALAEAEIRQIGAQQTLANLGLPVQVELLRGLPPETIGERLRFLGLDEISSALAIKNVTTATLIPIRAPRAGVVVTRSASLGQVVDASKTLFVVADPERMWLTLHVRPDALKPFRESDPTRLLMGRTVHFEADGTRSQVSGKIVWVSTAIDAKSRTLEVRANLPNPGGLLRANAFGAGRIVLRSEASAVAVPDKAVHWDGNCHVVFVWDKNSPRKDAPKVFHVRSVQVGVRYEGKREIIAGVLPGEMVAAARSGVLRAELLKANLGEG